VAAGIPKSDFRSRRSFTGGNRSQVQRQRFDVFGGGRCPEQISPPTSGQPRAWPHHVSPRQTANVHQFGALHRRRSRPFNRADFNPTFGPTNTTGVINGLHFTGATVVTFNRVTASFSVPQKPDSSATLAFNRHHRANRCNHSIGKFHDDFKLFLFRR